MRYVLLAYLAFLLIVGCSAETVIYRNNNTNEEWKITVSRAGGKTTVLVNDQVVIVAWPGNGQNSFWANGQYKGHKVELYQVWDPGEIFGHWDANIYFDGEDAGEFEL